MNAHIKIHYELKCVLMSENNSCTDDNEVINVSRLQTSGKDKGKSIKEQFCLYVANHLLQMVFEKRLTVQHLKMS